MRSQWYNIFADEKNPIDYSGVIRKDIKSVKSFLTITLIVSLIANAIVTTLFGLSQGFTYVLICHIVLVAVDFIFLLLMLALNFRFKNAKFWMPTYLSIAIAIMIVALVLPFIDPKHQSMTYIAAGIYAAIDLVKIIAVIYAGKVAKTAAPTKNNKLVGILFSIFTAAVMAFYAIVVSFYGYFGQGINMRDKEATLVFSYENDCYTVVDKYDDGNIINIPNEFNGKPVKFIDATLVSNNSVNTIVINNSDVRFSNLSSLKTVNKDLTISCEVKNYNVIRKNLFTDLQAAGSTTGALLNKFIPSNVEENKYWIDFNYDGLDFIDQAYIESFSLTNKEYEGSSKSLLLSFMLQKNPSLKNMFKMSDDSFIDFMSLKNQQFLQDRFDNNKAKVLYQIDVVEKASHSVNINFFFDDVHKLNMSAGNDSKAQLAIDSFAKIGNTAYIIDSKSIDLYEKLPQRDGLSVVWSINYGTISDANAFAATVDSYKDQMNLTPIWTMNVPQVTTFASSSLNNQITYGDDASFTCVAKSDSKFPIGLEYELYYSSTTLVSSNTTGLFEYNGKTPWDSGNVFVRVKCHDAAYSDLTSDAINTAIINFVINKKPLSFAWTLDGHDYTDSITYDGNEHNVGCTFDLNELVYDDATKYSLADIYTSITSGKAAGSYNSQVSLKKEFAYYYSIDANTSGLEFTIDQKPINHSWDNLTLVYNAQSQKPTALIEASEICVGDSINITVTGSGKNAGAYKATVSIDNPNYVLIESNTIKDKDFTILRKEVTNPQFTSTSLEYKAVAIYPTLNAVDGLEGGEELNQAELSYSCSNNIDVGTDIQVECSFLDSSNYILNNDNSAVCLFDITPFELTVTWTSIEKQYNKQLQTATISTDAFKVDGDVVIVSGEIQDVGSTPVTAVLNTTNNAKSSNYTIKSGTESNTFNVLPRSINATWSGLTVTYDTTEHKPIADFGTGVIIAGDTVNVTIDGFTDAGTYNDLVASIDNTNYSLVNNTVKLIINKATAKVAWDSVTSYVYDGNSHSISATVTGVNDVVLASNVNGNGKDYKASGYEITVELTDPSDINNYSLDIAKKVLTITKKQLSINWNVEESGYTYDGFIQKPTATLDTSKVVLGDTVNVTVTAENKNAGTYNATATLDNSNYSIDKPTQSYTINPKEIVASWSNLALVYNASEQVPTCTFSVSDIFAGDELNQKVTHSGNGIDKNTYTATVAIYNGNYKVSSASSSTSYEIVVRSLTSSNISISGVSAKTYTGSKIEQSVVVKDLSNSSRQLITGTDYEVNYTDNINAGTASLTVTLKGNYDGSKNTTFTINKVTLTPYIASIKAKEYDKTISASEGVIGLNGAVNGEKPTATGTFVWSSENAGTTSIKATEIALDSAWKNNYQLSSTSYTGSAANGASISKKAVSANWTNLVATYSGSAQKPSYTFGSGVICTGDTVKVTIDAKVNAGTYNLVATIDNANYSLSNPNVEFTINPLAITPSVTAIANQTYTGSAITPSVEVKYNTKVLTSGTDYTVEYKNNVNVGTATATITLKGNYSGTTSITFAIVEKKEAK